MNKWLLLFGISLTLHGVSAAQNNGPWNGRKSAVVLTYDDAINEHFTNALPALDSLGLKGTFYITDIAGMLEKQIPQWRKAAANGHELGNHTVTHPCEGGRPGREFVKPETDLTRYSIQRIQTDVRTMNALLFAVDGKTERTFAYPCGDMSVGGIHYLKGIESMFVGARGVAPSIRSAANVDLLNINSLMINGQTADQLIAQVKQAQEKQGLLVFLFHGVGGGHGLNVSNEAHRQLLRYLKGAETDIWVAPMVDVAQFIKTQQVK
ncbi:polysaccharide deacetylase family protein [Rudanella paleaurantiibacter]|uniref:Polysaccharide deacetylase family protein n=1 Tax=Rudanella paleaurantiibacter TaxID=2614655 RepID=A0A7J5TXR6_9BACT|nr:polysaccharide deacetylase family protein [Rudanella paleaurantiibacter]KAB7729933.1 polysaccharide deacetylase family protein [Rudanella paleaurantiibacter]